MSTMSAPRQAATWTVYIAIVAVYFVIPDMGYIAPSLAAIAETYGVDTGTASYLSTLVALLQVVGALTCGFIAGKYIRNKLLLSIAVGGMTVFGVAPALFTAEVPFMVLMVDRGIFGFFLGFLQPIIFAYVAHLFIDTNKRASAYGIGNVAFNVGAVFASSVGGICVTIGWNTAFWLYGVGLIVLICVILFFKEPETIVEEEEAEKGKKVRISALAWFYMAMFLLSQILFYPFFTAFVNSLIGHGVADGFIGGQLLSLFTVVGIVVSALFGVLFRLLHTRLLPLGFLTGGIGLAIIWAGLVVVPNLPVCVIGVCVLGAGQILITVSVPQCVSISCPAKVATAALAFTAVFMNLGTFFSSPYMQLVTTIANTSDYTVVFLVSAIAMVIISGLVMLVVRNVKPVKLPDGETIEIDDEEGVMS